LLLAACGSDGASSTPKSTPNKAMQTGSVAQADGCDAIDLPAPKKDEGFQVSIDMQLDPGEERQVCRLVMTPAAVNLNWSEGIYTKGSHHALLARTSYRDALPSQNIKGDSVDDASQVADCVSLGSDWDTQAVIAGGHAVGESPNTTLGVKGTLPDDVALKIASNEVLELNFHMFNAGDKPVHACYKQNLYGIPDEQVKQEAGSMFYYNPFITVPANSTATATMACPIAHDVTLGDQVSHMHSRGDGYTATLLDGDPLGGGNAVQELYKGTDWAEPVVKIDSPRIDLKQGQWIEWSCHYTNHESRNVAQGQQTTDEMCMFVGMYWPRSPEMDWCMPAPTDAMPKPKSYSAGRLLASGTMDGSQFLDCWTKSPQVIGGGGPDSASDRFASQSCFTGSCAKVSSQVNDFSSGKVDPTTVTCD
jgi:hypothetical protein